jgi:16S rRNA (adenine1518-N6/adenine1519-N6)-dimethyltransferase
VNRARRRHYGQNFLETRKAAELASDIPLPHETLPDILEIGPGHGALTEHLLPKCQTLTAVDADGECVELLNQKFASALQNKKVQFVHQDFLSFDLESWLAGKQNPWIVGNLPYNVGTKIVTNILPFMPRLAGAYFMLQLEVAERLCAQPGSRAYGSLSVFTQVFAIAALRQKVPPECFTPRPNVWSATLHLAPRTPWLPEEQHAAFFEFVQNCFRQKRKTLANNLKAAYKDHIEIPPEFPMNLRAEEISPEGLFKILPKS